MRAAAAVFMACSAGVGWFAPKYPKNACALVPCLLLVKQRIYSYQSLHRAPVPRCSNHYGLSGKKMPQLFEPLALQKNLQHRQGGYSSNTCFVTTT
jgi:hypothetical protein